jgi:hypothetical protein
MEYGSGYLKDFFFFENRVFYDVMWKNTAQLDGHAHYMLEN